MNKTLRFIISVVLVAALVFSSFVFANAAVVVTDEAGLRNALAGDATTIQIDGTINLTDQLDINRSVTIIGGTIVQKRTSSSLKEQVNAHEGTIVFKGTTLTVASGSNAPGLAIGGSTHVVLDGAILESETNDTVYFNGDFTGTLDIIGNSSLTNKVSGKKVINTNASSKGTINFVSGLIKSTGGDGIQLQGSHIFNVGGVAGQKAKMNITGDGFWFAGGTTVVNIYDGAEIIANTKFTNMNATIDSICAKMNIYGGTITTPGDFIYTQKTANVNIFGGTITTGGRFVYNKNNASKVFVSGGNITCNGTPFDVASTSSVDIVGGTFNFDPSAYVATGYGATASGSAYTVAANPGTATVVNNSAEFISAVDSGAAHIKLGASFELGATAVIDSDVYIDGNGYQITGGSQIQVKGNGNTVTFKNVKYTRGSDAVMLMESPNLIISGGELSCTHKASGPYNNEGT